MKKEILKASFYCLLIALCLRMAWAQTMAPTPNPAIISQDNVIVLRGKVQRQMQTWLSIEAHNQTAWLQDGFDPSFTIIVSDCKPMFRHLPNGQWEIAFLSVPTAKRQ